MKTGDWILKRKPVSSEFQRILIPSMMLGMVLLLMPSNGFAGAQAGTGPSLAPWTGIWRIVDEGAFPNANAADASAIVEIRPTADGLGLEISRLTPQKTAVKEIVIPDGVARPISGPDCTGTQTARWLPDAGAIAGSSETKCRDSGAFATSSLRLLLPEGKMADILAVKTSGQTRLAVRRFSYIQPLSASGSARVESEAAVIAAQAALSAPWTLDRIIQLSSLVDSTVLEAALLEKNPKLEIAAAALKRLAAAKVADGIIDLLVAQAFPSEFEIQKNGQIELRPPSSSLGYGYASARADFSPRGSGLGGYYYSGGFYGCSINDPFYWGLPPNVDLYSPLCWTYYSPTWMDYRISLYDSGYTTVDRNNGRLDAGVGYTQVGIRDTVRHAVPRETSNPRTGYSSGNQGSSGRSASSSDSGSSGSSSGGSSSGSSSSSPSASPGGYSSGSNNEGGGSARPR
jgi:hypothetical protein